MTAALGELSPTDVRRRLRAGALRIGIGPFTVCLRSGLVPFGDWLRQLYRDYPVCARDGFSDFHIRIDTPNGVRRWWRPQVEFSVDGDIPFKPLPRSQACPFFEWGLNWCVAQRAQQYLIVHAAVVERDGFVLLLPGAPGAGKSTLCAGLVARGWRLFSDELALVRPGEALVDAFPRPVSLKDHSIPVIRAFAPDMVMGPPCHDTAKGTVVHVRPPASAVASADVPARPGWIVFPAFARGVETRLEPRAPEAAFRELLDNAFNYSVQGARGFSTLADLVEGCPPHTLQYGDLDAACEELESLAVPSARDMRIESGL